FFFFFSSRRRHTRSKRDWSSDVCSSDLMSPLPQSASCFSDAPASLLLYDEVLKGEAGASEKQEALCGKGDIFFEMAGNDSNNYQRAIEVYDRLASDKNEPIHWRNQALFKKGLCLEKKSDRAGALATFY